MLHYSHDKVLETSVIFTPPDQLRYIMHQRNRVASALAAHAIAPAALPPPIDDTRACGYDELRSALSGPRSCDRLVGGLRPA
jgi:hypothetical protein